jgi:hypothetical protein
MELIVTDLIGTNRKGNALLCYFWGETDRPIVVIAKTSDEVWSAITDHWTGDSLSRETNDALRDIDDNDFSENPVFEFEFEIGGARFEDVCA